jgi:hypothetical protein
MLVKFFFLPVFPTTALFTSFLILGGAQLYGDVFLSLVLDN